MGSSAAEEHLKKIATPIRLMQHVAPTILGYEFAAPEFLLYAENRVLEAVMSPEQRFVMITVPPRHSKSTTFGVGLAAWYLGLFPHHQVIYTSYGEDIASNTGAATRDIHAQYGKELFGRGVSKSAYSSTDWKIEGHQGGMLSVGANGPITGKAGNLVIVDDLYKGPEDANSLANRTKILDWFDQVVRTRIEPGGTLIMMFTRWREDDLIGTLVERGKQEGFAGDHWELINFPAICVAPDEDAVKDGNFDLDLWVDAIDRRPGDALWPMRYPVKVLEQIRANNVGVFNAMYQGDPQPSKGSMFPRDKWRRWSGAPPECGQRIRIWDLAASENAGDWTVGELWGKALDGKMVLLDMERDRLNGDAVSDLVAATALRDGPEVKIYIEQERSGSGKGLVSLYQRLLRGYNVEGVRPEGDKVERTKPYSIIQQRGECIIPETFLHERAFLQEHERFGKGNGHDDCVDPGTYAVQKLIAAGLGTMFIPSLEGGIPDMDNETQMLIAALMFGGAYR